MKKKSKFLLAISLLFSGVLPVMSSCTKKIDYVSQTHLDVPKEVWCGEDTTSPSVAFTDRGFGVVTLKTGIDGDTAHFYDTRGRIVKGRFNGVDTPESTGSVEKWGKAASKYTTGILENAKTIVLETDRGTYNYNEIEGPEYDSGGTRALVWVWASERPIEEEDGSQLMLINLGLVQNGYSAVKSISGLYYQAVMMDADFQAQKLKLHIWSKENDPLYVDPKSQPIQDITLVQLYEALYEDESSVIGRTYNFTGIVTRKFGQYDAYMEEYTYDSNNSLTSRCGIYIFTMYNYSGARTYFKEGRKITFHAMVGEYSGAYQLHNMKFASSSKYANEGDVKFVDNVSYTIENPIVKSGAQFNSEEKLTDFNCLHKISGVTVTGGYGGTMEKDKNGDYNTKNSMTLYCVDSEGGEFTARIDDSVIINYFGEDSSIRITSYKAFVTYCEAGATFDFVGIKGFFQYDEDSTPVIQLLLLKTADITYHAA